MTTRRLKFGGIANGAAITIEAGFPGGPSDSGSATDWGNLVVEAVDLDPQSDGTIDFVITDSGSTSVTLEVISPNQPRYEGTYTLTGDDFNGGPVNLVPARITGSGRADEDLTASGGLWAYLGTGFSVAKVWQDDGVNITGDPSGTTYTLTASEVGSTVTFYETATDSTGETNQASNGIVARAAAIFTDDFSSYSPGADILGSSNWNVINGTAGYVFEENDGQAHLYDTSGFSRFSGVYTGTVADDQSAEIVWSDLIGDGASTCFLGVRMETASGNYASGYYVRLTETQYEISFRNASSSKTDIYTAGAGFEQGSTIRISATGSAPVTITIYKDNVQVHQLTHTPPGDGSCLGGTAGVQAFLDDDQIYVLDDFVVENL